MVQVMLAESWGVETSVFHSHFTWAASATKVALSGLTTEEIMTAADWSSKGTFQKFYYKPFTFSSI